MTKEELEKVVQGAEYDFLRENPHLGSNIMFLTLGGSHAYGTNVPGSDVDVRGVTGDSKFVNAALTNFPLRDFKSLIKAVNATVGQFDSLGKRNTKKDFPHINKHAMHLVRLYLMAFDILERGEINTYRDKEHDLLMDIRNGKFVQEDGTYRQEFFEMVDEYEKRLKYDAENSPLPQKPDMKKIEELVMTVNESLLEKQYKR